MPSNDRLLTVLRGSKQAIGRMRLSQRPLRHLAKAHEVHTKQEAPVAQSCPGNPDR